MLLFKTAETIQTIEPLDNGTGCQHTSAMSQTRKELKTKFAPHTPPDLLGQLADYWDKHPEFFSGSFEVSSDEYDMLEAWFRGSQEGISRIRIFGHDGVGSLIGLWFYEGLTGEPPVIFLGSEGEGNALLAGNMSEYLAVLAANRDWEPLDRAFMDAEESNAEENERFCSWLSKHGIRPAKDPAAVMKAARKKHPDFAKWLSSVRPELQ